MDAEGIAAEGEDLAACAIDGGLGKAFLLADTADEFFDDFLEMLDDSDPAHSQTESLEVVGASMLASLRCLRGSQTHSHASRL